MLSVVGFFGREFDSPRLHHFNFCLTVRFRFGHQMQSREKTVTKLNARNQLIAGVTSELPRI
jgi:hypothetical protein